MLVKQYFMHCKTKRQLFVEICHVLSHRGGRMLPQDYLDNTEMRKTCFVLDAIVLDLDIIMSTT